MSLLDVAIHLGHRRMQMIWSSIFGDRAFPVAAARIWNSLPQSQQVTSAPSLLVFRSRLEIHIPMPAVRDHMYSARAVTLSCWTL